MAVHIILLRAIGPSTHKILTMKQLETACRAAKLERTRNVLATGNLIVETDWPKDRVRETVARLMRGFGLTTAVLIRGREELARIVKANPFPDAAQERPSQLQINFLEERPTDDAIDALRARAGPERIARVAGGIYIDYAGRISDSKLTPAIVERILKSTSTARNWNTIAKLLAIAGEM
jgi:uncharacterized protein (DUF1697 family)